MSRAEAHDFVQFGRLWFAEVWLGKNEQTRAHARAGLLNNFNGNGNNFVLSRGWRAYDPVVRVRGARADAYATVCARLHGNPGDAEAARQLLDWAKGDLGFADLSQDLQLLALITHLCEVARGYSGSLELELYPFLRDVQAGDLELDVIASHFYPALTYRVDVGMDWEPAAI
jgi:hypothetical protein